MTSASDPGKWVDGFADGACSGNPGPGGWAFRLEWPEGALEASGAEPVTTNNRMELTAAREAMSAFLKRRRAGQRLRLHTDSRNVIGWLGGGWRRKINLDLYPAIDRLVAELGPDLSWSYVQGHAGIPGNDRVDRLAVKAREEAAPKGM